MLIRMTGAPDGERITVELTPELQRHVLYALVDRAAVLRKNGLPPMPPEMVSLVRRLHRLAQSRERQRQISDDLKTQVFGHYGEACACCGTTERLSIDHVNGDGQQHRLQVFGTARCDFFALYRWLIDNGFPDGFQTLCVPCNSSKKAGRRCQLDHGNRDPRAERARAASAARTARWRARQRGEDVPLRRPGRPRKNVTFAS